MINILNKICFSLDRELKSNKNLFFSDLFSFRRDKWFGLNQTHQKNPSGWLRCSRGVLVVGGSVVCSCGSSSRAGWNLCVTLYNGDPGKGGLIKVGV